ncbi:hypothetical protein NRB56_15180 [Nocardia sp. RB56]|uniref:Uncharacterized protein n=1 Tax=Nocardia aurantia TaxID=2585199 RepID=A0A7K0DJS1_9NOCA|nr:hypothetical protein [Nocardia aurantia]
MASAAVSGSCISHHVNTRIRRHVRLAGSDRKYAWAELYPVGAVDPAVTFADLEALTAGCLAHEGADPARIVEVVCRGLRATQHRNDFRLTRAAESAGQPPRVWSRRPRLTLVAALRGMASTISMLFGTL